MNKLLPAQLAARPAPAISFDGYIRMRLRNLNTLSFVHLYSECDSDLLEELTVQTLPARAAGFSEWQSETHPAVSLGWGWFVHCASDRMLLAPEAVRSNLMLVDAFGYDLGPEQTSALLRAWLNQFDWQDFAYLAMRTGAPSC